MSYPTEFNDLINQGQSHLASKLYQLLTVGAMVMFCPFCLVHTAHAEKLFNLLEGYADSTKKKVQLWPLMNVLLILCPVRYIQIYKCIPNM